jgi:hypothetical protein
MKLRTAPEIVLAAYRVGDSPPNGVSPLMPYFALIVVFAQRYQKDPGIGTVVAMMLPYGVAISIVWILDNQVVPNQVGLGLVDEIRSYLDGLPPRELAEALIGGLSTYDFPETHGGEMLKLAREAAGITEYLLPPLPNTIYTRDTTCWIYGGVTLNPLYWPARHEETILVTAIYNFHPDFAGKVNVWGRPDR